MLFSDKDLAAYLQDRFEPAWESVRAVPTVTIDFGGGDVLRRTLHGNVATYVCDSEGRVLDVIAGLYEPSVYRERLAEASALAAALHRRSGEHDALRAAYHRKRLAASAQTDRRRVPDLTKSRRVEGPLEELVRRRDMERRRVPDETKTIAIEGPLEDLVEERGGAPGASLALLDRIPWDAIRRDTQHNETVRRKKVHQILSEPRAWTPAALTKIVYRDVLGTDLDDPYLGLRAALTHDYPFER